MKKTIHKPYPENSGTIIAFTGGDIAAHRDTLIRMNAPAIKLSYFGLTQRKTDIEQLKEDLNYFEYVILDPGMGSVRGLHKKYGSSFKPEYYIEKYYDFCYSIREHVTFIMAYDMLSDNFGYDDIREFTYLGLTYGLNIAPTIHAIPQRKLFDAGYLDDFDIVNIMTNDKNWAHTTDVFDKIAKRGIKIHGHAVTNMQKYQYLPFYSTDTSAWLDGQKFGTTYKYVNNKIMTYNVRDKAMIRRSLFPIAVEYGIDTDLIEADINGSFGNDVMGEVNALNLIAWLQFASARREANYARR